MEKQRNKFLISIILLSTLFVTNIVLFAMSVFKWWLFVIFFVILSVLIGICSFMFVKISKKIKKTKTTIKETESTGNYKTDLYTLLGIPVQYNKDGTIKDIYDLLGIEPVYDDKGNRVLTVYELLEIMPKFNNKGEEIPTVIAIKNRVGGIAKVDVSSRVLTRKLSDEEKEQIAIMEVLKQKLKEAEAQGDASKQAAINNIIKAKSNEKKGSSSKQEVSTPKPQYVMGKGGKAVSAKPLPQYGKTASNPFDVIGGKKSDGSKSSGGGQETKKVKAPIVPVQPENPSQKEPLDPTNPQQTVVNDSRKYIMVDINLEGEREL